MILGARLQPRQAMSQSWLRVHHIKSGGVGLGRRASGSPLTADAPLHRGELTKWAITGREQLQ
jgi:hypothetical protein